MCSAVVLRTAGAFAIRSRLPRLTARQLVTGKETYSPPTITAALQDKLLIVDQAHQRLIACNHGDAWKQAAQQTLAHNWTYHSNTIEGSRISLDETVLFLEQGIETPNRPAKDYIDARNHMDAIAFVEARQQPVSPFFLRSVNGIILRHTGLLAGAYKKVPNYALEASGKKHEYVHPFLVDEQVQALCDWINSPSTASSLHPLVIAAIAHYNFVRIHPFVDGNGRGTRLLMNTLIREAGYAFPAVVRCTRRTEYIDCLIAADGGQLAPLAEFIAEEMLATLQGLTVQH